MQFPDFFAAAPVVTADTGFRGLGRQFNRRNKLFFSQPIKAGSLRLTRLDSEQSIEVSADLSKVPGDPRIAELMPQCLKGDATIDEQRFTAGPRASDPSGTCRRPCRDSNEQHLIRAARHGQSASKIGAGRAAPILLALS